MKEVTVGEEIHKKYLDDVTLEISQDTIWRKGIFEGQYDVKILITYQELSTIPKYLKDVFKRFKLEYHVSKTDCCPEHFDKNLVIFKFEAKEFPHLVRYSGNNPSVI